MTDAPTDTCRRALDEALAAGGTVSPATLATLAAAPADACEAALRAFADAGGERTLGVLLALSETTAGDVRRSATSWQRISSFDSVCASRATSVRAARSCASCSASRA